jgi:hypothetical protein
MLKIPASVTNIGYDAFVHCENIYLDVSANEYAAAYALELRRLESNQKKIENANRRGREMSTGRVGRADDSLYSPDEVRAMTQSEVRENYQKIRLSMKSWK